MIPVLGLASGLGGSHDGSRLGPLVIQQNFSVGVSWKEIFHPQSNYLNKSDEIFLLNQKLAEKTYATVLQNPFTFVVGGDHSCAIGTWSGVAEALQAKDEDLAVIWMDAHMDAHTPETSPSGNIHGMPLATLLGYGSDRLTSLLSARPKLKPENVFLIGIQSYEKEEKKFLEDLNIRIYYIDEVHERGLNAIFSEIVENLSSRNIPYGISLDIDFFDSQKMSATGTPAENGVDPQEFINHYDCFDEFPPIVFEYVEFNPPHDRENQSLNWTVKILQRALNTWVSARQNEFVEIK